MVLTVEPLPSLDLLVAGEVLADFIAAEPGRRLSSGSSFHRVLGGSVANVAVAFSHLGGSAAISAVAGLGPNGQFVVDELTRHGVETRLVRRTAGPTTVAFVSGAAMTPEFEIHRGVDHLLRPLDLPSGILDKVPAFHTSAFSLSREPARSSILDALARVRSRGGLTSIDLNYEASVWGGRSGRTVLSRAVELVDLVKVSRDDLGRLFGTPPDIELTARLLHDWGARIVVVTLGRDGCRYSEGGQVGHIAAPRADAVDSTGAGDAFWAGFLRATLLGAGPLDAARLGTLVAGLKIGSVGPLDENIDGEMALLAVAAR